MAHSGPPPSNATTAEKLKWSLDSRPDYSNHEIDDHKNSNDTAAPDLEKLKIKDETPEEQVDGLVRDFLDIGGRDVLLRKPREEKRKNTKIQKDSQNARTSS